MKIETFNKRNKMSDKECVDMSGMEEHYIIVDHTDNSGLSVHKPTEKDIKLFKTYGTMECGNTTHVVPYRLLRLYQKLSEINDRLLEMKDELRGEKTVKEWDCFESKYDELTKQKQALMVELNKK